MEVLDKEGADACAGISLITANLGYHPVFQNRWLMKKKKIY